jgi:hypothetical protein
VRIVGHVKGTVLVKKKGERKPAMKLEVVMERRLEWLWTEAQNAGWTAEKFFQEIICVMVVVEHRAGFEARKPKRLARLRKVLSRRKKKWERIDRAVREVKAEEVEKIGKKKPAKANGGSGRNRTASASTRLIS